MLQELAKRLELKKEMLEALEEDISSIKEQIIEELKKSKEKNYKNEKALYSLVTKTNDKFDENKFKEENEKIYNKYLKTKVSFDITTFKKQEKELTQKYTEKGEITYQLMIKENKVENVNEKNENISILEL